MGLFVSDMRSWAVGSDLQSLPRVERSIPLGRPFPRHQMAKSPARTNPLAHGSMTQIQ